MLVENNEGNNTIENSLAIRLTFCMALIMNILIWSEWKEFILYYFYIFLKYCLFNIFKKILIENWINYKTNKKLFIYIIILIYNLISNYTKF